MTRAAAFEVDYTQYLNEASEVVQALPVFARNADTLIDMYRWMVLTRTFDKKAIALQRTGKLGTYPSSLGQEAVSVGLASVMRPNDVLFPYYREYGGQFMRGVTMSEILLYWGGDERGMNYRDQRQDFPICVPIATHGPQAAGTAYAFKLRKEKRVAVYVCGEGATSKGDFYETVNAAGVWKLPLLILVNNNQYAISVPRSSQTGAGTIAQKAIAGGFIGEQVDGNDVIAIRDRVEKALAKARDGGGPTLIEALTYRLGDHTTADDATRYRTEEEVNHHWKLEPVLRLRRYMTAQGIWSDKQEEVFQAECTQKVEAAVREYLDTPPQPPESMFDFMFETPTHDLLKQREYFLTRKVTPHG